MITYPREWNGRKEKIFDALARSAGGKHQLLTIGWSWADFPESKERTEAALKRAKRLPKSRWMRFLKRWLIRGQYNWSRRYFRKHPDRIAVAWNGLTGSRKAFLDGARDANAACLHLELSPLPGRVTVDHAGVNAESSVPQSAAFFQQWAQDANDRTDESWKRLGSKLVGRKSRRADVAQVKGDKLAGQKYIFCPLQVPGDSQIKLFADWCRDLEGFISVVGRSAELLPEGWHIRIKEHPSARQSLRAVIEPFVASGKVVVDNQTDTFDQVAASKGVITLNSSVGLQAFFFDRPVVVLGRCFFAQSQLVHVVKSESGLADLLRNPEALTFDKLARNQFMNWLDQVYYPLSPGGTDGALTDEENALSNKLAIAREQANTRSIQS